MQRFGRGAPLGLSAGDAPTLMLNYHKVDWNRGDVRLYGTTAAGESVSVTVEGFSPGFFVALPSEAHADGVKQELVDLADDPADVTEVSVVHKSIIGDADAVGAVRPYLFVRYRNEAARKRASLHVREGQVSGVEPNEIHEDRIPPDVQFVALTGAKPFGWVTLGDGWEPVHDRRRTTTTQAEYKVPLSGLVVLPDREKPAPLVVMAVDIEVDSAGGNPADPNNRILCISAVTKLRGCPGGDKHLHSILLSANRVDAEGAATPFEPLMFGSEAEMLDGFAQLMRAVDPDVLTGHNVLDFDLVCIVERARVLHVGSVEGLGRTVRSRKLWVRTEKFKSRQRGTRENRSVEIEGRSIFDMLPAVQANYKYDSYTLGAIALEQLGDTKEDVPWYLIASNWEKGGDARRRVASYCVKDSLLVHKLLDKNGLLNSYIALATVTSTPMYVLLFKGQQQRVIAQLLPMLAKMGILLPFVENWEEHDDSGLSRKTSYGGGLVLEPKRGYYTRPIVCLDFSSLYPTIMMAYNMCYTTLMRAGRIAEARALPCPADMIKIGPLGHGFMKKEAREGVLPKLLFNLVSSRKAVQNRMREIKESDPAGAASLNLRQIAIKFSANSIYGFTGATVGKLPCLEIASSVTAWGQQHLRRSAEIAQKASYDVIYGDTDSVMIDTGVSPEKLDEAFEIAEKVAATINSELPKPMEIVVEKAMLNSVFINKKMYASLIQEKGKQPTLFFKGISVVRRDRVRYVRTTGKRFLELLLKESDPDGARQYLAERLVRLRTGHVPVVELLKSQSLSKPIDEYAKSEVHASVARRAARRDPSYSVKPGTRIPYVYVVGGKKSKKSEVAEDPTYALKNSLTIDYATYAEDLWTAMSDILPLVYGHAVVGKLRHTMLAARPPSLEIAAPSTSSFLDALGVTYRCKGCRGTVPKPGWCRRCIVAGAAEADRQAAVVEAEKAKAEADEAWDKCNKCQDGDIESAKLCSARDCPNFYVRLAADMAVERTAAVVIQYTQ